MASAIGHVSTIQLYSRGETFQIRPRGLDFQLESSAMQVNCRVHTFFFIKVIFDVG